MAMISMPDGQELEYPDDVAGDDQMLKDALSPFAPDVRNAELKRSTKNGVMCVQVIKKAGTKGGAIWDDLISAPEIYNPALLLQQKLQKLEAEGALDSHALAKMARGINRAIEAGREELRAPGRTLRALADTDAAPAPKVPVGF